MCKANNPKPIHVTKRFIIVENNDNKWLVLQDIYEHIYNRGAFLNYNEAFEFVKAEIKEPLNIIISFTEKEMDKMGGL